METSNTRLTRKEKRVLRQTNKQTKGVSTTQEKLNFTLKHVEPLTLNQRLSFEAYHQGKNLMLHGMAGTGKSFIAVYLALKNVLSENSEYKKVIIVRSTVPTRDIGFLPGKPADKIQVYEAPYYAICSELFGRGDSYNYLKSKGIIEFIPTSFIRGLTINNSIIIVDEIANLTLHELDTVITRIGKNCRIVFCGDFRQSDFTKEQDRGGLKDFTKIVQRMKSFTFVDFQIEDIVRSGLVKDYLIQKDRLQIAT